MEDAEFSHDGKWIGYQSNETGREEIYILPFPEVNQEIAVSSVGGSQLHWSRDGRFLYYVWGGRMLMKASIQFSKNGLQVTGVEPLFRVELGGSLPGPGNYDVSDDNLFLVLKNAEVQPHSAITLIINWPQALPRTLPTA